MNQMEQRERYFRFIHAELVVGGVNMQEPTNPYGVSISRRGYIQMKISACPRGLPGVTRGGQIVLRSLNDRNEINARLEVDAWCIVNEHRRALENRLNYTYTDEQKYSGTL